MCTSVLDLHKKGSQHGAKHMAIAFLLGAFGALVAEVLKRWQQWSDLPEDQFRALVKSVKFWAATLFLILLGGLAGIFAGTRTQTVDWQLCFFGGIGFMSIIRNILAALAAQNTQKAARAFLKFDQFLHYTAEKRESLKAQMEYLQEQGTLSANVKIKIEEAKARLAALEEAAKLELGTVNLELEIERPDTLRKIFN